MDQKDSSIQWSAPEFEPLPAHGRIFFFLMMVFFGSVVYALVENSPIMAITFVLLGAVTYIQSRKAPHDLLCRISPRGIEAGKDFYPFDNILSFWIVYEAEEKRLFLKTNGAIVSSVRIPLGTMSPNAIRETLIAKGLQEKPYEPSAIDTLSDFLHI